jgi:hypothetical protein
MDRGVVTMGEEPKTTLDKLKEIVITYSNGDRIWMLEFDSLIPYSIFFHYCPKCDTIGTTFLAYNTSMDTVRIAFPQAVKQMENEVRRCPNYTCDSYFQFVGFAHISEGWWVETDGETPTVPISEHPDRYEVVQRILKTANESFTMNSRVIRDDITNQVMFVSEPEIVKASIGGIIGGVSLRGNKHYI